MKKYLLLLMALSLILSNMAPIRVYAESELDKQLEKIVLKVKELMDISEEYDTFDSRVNSYDKDITFYLNWSDSKEKLPSISIAVDSKGNIKSYNRYYPYYEEPEKKLPNYSREEGEKIALEFIKKIDPELLDEIKLDDNITSLNFQNPEYHFRFFRYVNNIPYYDNSVSISINKYTGDIISYYYTDWDRNLTFPDVSKAISLEDGKTAFKDNIGLELIYRQSNVTTFKIPETNEETNYFLIYSTIDNKKVIDAITGNPISLNYYGDYTTLDAEEVGAAGDAEKRAITPEERKEIEKLSGIKDILEIEKIARDILQIDEDYKLNTTNLHSDWKNQNDFQWSLYFIKEVDKDKIAGVNINLDAKTGELIHFYQELDQDKNAKPSINKDQALTLAKEYIKKVSPDKANKTKYIDNENINDGERTYNFGFIRKEKDIYVKDDSIRVGVDTVNEKIFSYSSNWYKSKLPPVGRIISLDKAYEVLFDEIGYELMYVTYYRNNKIEGINKEVKLIYNTKPGKPLNISATTGELLDYRGKPFKESNIINYKDIDKSYAKDKIMTLAQYGIFFEGEDFRPKDKIRQKDFMYLIWKSLNPYRIQDEMEIDKIYNDLINRNILKEEEREPDKYVSKEEGVKFIIRTMGYDKVANIENIYKDVFKDTNEISKELKGYVTLAYALGIIQGDGKLPATINPKNELKREDAANIIYNYVFN